jgi:hypothetical protein
MMQVGVNRVGRDNNGEARFVIELVEDGVRTRTIYGAEEDAKGMAEPELRMQLAEHCNLTPADIERAVSQAGRPCF